MKRGKLLFNTVILTVSSLAIRALGLLFKIFISNKIGAEGVGLFQLIFSVYFLFITIVTAGISLGVTRMVSEKIASQNEKAISRIMRGCMGFSIATGLFCTVIMHFGADIICTYWIRDIRCINAVKVLSLSLPFMAMASCLKGYFIGVRRVMKSSAVQVFEQISRIIIVVLLIGFFIPTDISFSLEIIAWGDTLSEIVAFILLLSLYLGERKHNKSEKNERKFSPVKRLIGICSPILTSSLARSLLSSYENILIPHGLSKTGLSREQSLSKYGALKGMTMPILFFPSSLLSAFSTLLVPEITYYSAKNRTDKVSEIIKKVIKITFIMSFFVFIIFFSCGKGIGRLIYNNSDVSFFLVAVSPLVPLMYMESVVDGMLKALNQQFYTMKYNLIDAFLRVGLMFFLVPLKGVYGLLAVMFISNFFTAILCLRRLIKVSRIDFSYLRYIIKPFLCSLCSIGVIKLMENKLPTVFYIGFAAVFGGVIYFIMLFVFGCMKKNDMDYFREVLKKK